MWEDNIKIDLKGAEWRLLFHDTLQSLACVKDTVSGRIILKWILKEQNGVYFFMTRYNLWRV